MGKSLNGDSQSYKAEPCAEPGEEGAFGGEVVTGGGPGVFVEGSLEEAEEHFPMKRRDWKGVEGGR